MATIRPPLYSNMEQDCHILHRAFRGFGTDDYRVIQILAHKNTPQRLEIGRHYKATYGEDLAQRLRSELHGNFERAVLLWMLDPAIRDAELLHDAFAGLGTKDSVLIDILCTRTSTQLQLIKQAYYARYNAHLEQDVAAETSGHYQELLLACIGNHRPDTPAVDWGLARVEARELYRAGEGHVGTDEKRFIGVLSSRGPAQLAATLTAYKEMHGHSLEVAIKRETSGHFQQALKAIVKANYPARYFAQALNKATKGRGTDNERLIQLVVSRAEIDMQYIKAEFQNKYNKSLAGVIQEELSGDYRDFLLALIGEY